MIDLTTLECCQAALGASPFQQALGLNATGLDPDAPEIEITLPYSGAAARSAGSDQLHGGVLASLIDIAGDYVLAIRLGRFPPTINLHTDYLRPSHGTVRARARIVRLGRTIGVADVEVFDAGDRLVAAGRGTYATGGGTT